ncbi:hypothetical protein [Streptomyces sp. NPDC002133]|uniref:hypothetical protein n=1 Tax=Streptomyces sp. NPDC002133 TaxID=3154409 RepID=UPI00331F1D08
MATARLVVFGDGGRMRTSRGPRPRKRSPRPPAHGSFRLIKGTPSTQEIVLPEG